MTEAPAAAGGALFCGRCGTLLDVDAGKHAAVCALCGASRSFAGALPARAGASDARAAGAALD
jgi:hypothetical protein